MRRCLVRCCVVLFSTTLSCTFLGFEPRAYILRGICFGRPRALPVYDLFPSNLVYLNKVHSTCRTQHFYQPKTMRMGWIQAKPSMVTWGAGPRTIHGNARGKPSMVGWGGVSTKYLPSVVTWTQTPVTGIYFFKRLAHASSVPSPSKLSWNADFYQVET